MSKRIILSIIFILICTITMGADKFTITAKIKNLKDKELILRLYDVSGKQRFIDSTIVCKNGKFNLEYNISEPIYVTITPKSGFLDTKKIRGVIERKTMQINLYALPNESYNISGEVDGNNLHYTISGSEINSVLSDMRKEQIKAFHYYDMESEYFRDDRTKEERDSVYGIGNTIYDDFILKAYKYIRNNPNSQISGLFISKQNNAVFDLCYPKLSAEVVNGVFKTEIERKRLTCERMKINNKMNAGADIIDFTLNGLDGTDLTLSSLKGEYVLLYFWGSWCHWCIAGVPNLNKLHDDLHGKVKIIGIACNDKESSLLKVISDNNIKWDNYLDTLNLSHKYGISGYPTKFLISPEGKIIFKYEGEHKNFYTEVLDYIK